MRIGELLEQSFIESIRRNAMYYIESWNNGAGFGRGAGLMTVHWSPEACIADAQTKDGGLTKVMSSSTTVLIQRTISIEYFNIPFST